MRRFDTILPVFKYTCYDFYSCSVYDISYEYVACTRGVRCVPIYQLITFIAVNPPHTSAPAAHGPRNGHAPNSTAVTTSPVSRHAHAPPHPRIRTRTRHTLCILSGHDAFKATPTSQPAHITTPLPSCSPPAPHSTGPPRSALQHNRHSMTVHYPRRLSWALGEPSVAASFITRPTRPPLQPCLQPQRWQAPSQPGTHSTIQGIFEGYQWPPLTRPCC